MKIVHTHTLIGAGKFAASPEWTQIRRGLHDAVRLADWPPGSGTFTIHPTKKGNGVAPIKDACIRKLESLGWKREQRLDIATAAAPGKLDAVFQSSAGVIAMEWETGNISSSHRAMNKMALGLLKGVVAATSLVIPSRRLYTFLTDRIGNEPELEPYFDLWKSLPIRQGIFEVIVIEQDHESTKVPLIPKGTDGRAKG